ncbi:Hypothetical protein CINCED_3A016018 [Cinara cedri]|uniref:Uncharacterized protein n=1 Tax=Cinara cedri TaxID=506608 RepID=A0A5E4N791_9HEMI|nr:Hypothetical protein CINCED_3A016018 [Cinara cedri]
MNRNQCNIDSDYPVPLTLNTSDAVEQFEIEHNTQSHTLIDLSGNIDPDYPIPLTLNTSDAVEQFEIEHDTQLNTPIDLSGNNDPNDTIYTEH